MYFKRNFVAAFSSIAVLASVLTIHLATTFAAPTIAPDITKIEAGSQMDDGSGYLEVVVTVEDQEGDTLSMAIECGDKSYSSAKVVSTNNGVLSKDKAPIYQIEQIDASKGPVDVEFVVDTKNLADGVDTKSFQCRAYASDGVNVTKTPVEVTGISIDNLAPDPNDDAEIQIATDANKDKIAAIGDTFTLIPGTENTGDTVTWYLQGDSVTGESQILENKESAPIISGTMDYTGQINVTVVDDMGNEADAMTANLVSIDQEAPSLKNTGTLSITTDNNSNGIAEVGDGVTFTGATVSVDDGDTITIDLTDLTGDSEALQDTEYTIISGSQNGSETYTVTATDNAGNTFSKASNSITVDNTGGVPEDPSIEIGFSSSGTSVDEADGKIDIFVNLSETSDSDITVDYTVTDGDATKDSDYYLEDGTLTISANNLSGTFDITIIDDEDFEGSTETVEITLSKPSGAELNLNTQHTITISDNDTDPGKEDPKPSSNEINFAAGSTSTGEDVSSSSISVVTINAVAVDVTVDYAVTGGTAVKDSDYTLEDGTLTITSGGTVGLINIGIIDDNEEESQETIEITLSNASGIDLGTSTVHTVFIDDNDQSTDPDPGDDKDDNENDDKECKTVVINNIKTEVCESTNTNTTKTTGSSTITNKQIRNNFTDSSGEKVIVKFDIPTNKDTSETTNTVEQKSEIKITQEDPKAITQKLAEQKAAASSNESPQQIKDHWAEKELNTLIELKIVSSDTAPDKQLSRSEVIQTVFETAGLSVDSNVDTDTAYTEAAKELKIVSQNRKQDPATRAEALKIVLNTFDVNLKKANNNNNFDDVKDGDWFADLVNFAFENGIVEGYGDATFKPNQEITAAEIAKIVTRTAEKLGQ